MLGPNKHLECVAHNRGNNTKKKGKLYQMEFLGASVGYHVVVALMDRVAAVFERKGLVQLSFQALLTFCRLSS